MEFRLDAEEILAEKSWFVEETLLGFPISPGYEKTLIALLCAFLLTTCRAKDKKGFSFQVDLIVLDQVTAMDFDLLKCSLIRKIATVEVKNSKGVDCVAIRRQLTKCGLRVRKIDYDMCIVRSVSLLFSPVENTNEKRSNFLCTVVEITRAEFVYAQNFPKIFRWAPTCNERQMCSR